MRSSKLLRKLRANLPVLTIKLDSSVNPLGIQLAGKVGFDGVWICTEHRPICSAEVAECLRGALLGDIDAVVRVRKGEGYTSFFRPLEDGAAGIMVPHVKTAAEAAWVVENARFPPLGRRGIENVMPDADLGFASGPAYLEHANRETFVVIQIEDAEALEQMDAIAAVPGYDVIFIGWADLSVSLGVPFEFEHPKLRSAEEAIAAAARRHSKYWGCPVSNPRRLADLVARGARYFNVGSDYGLLRSGMTSLLGEMRAAAGGEPR